LSSAWASLGQQSEMIAFARSVLLPDVNGRLDRFFTTTRSFFGPLGEQILAAGSQAWI